MWCYMVCVIVKATKYRVENNLVYFAQKRWLICDCDSFLGC